ncbi:choice-of-anchor Q domain-containing protein, partial [Candidatus Margulisiibacteriota bacterium]
DDVGNPVISHKDPQPGGTLRVDEEIELRISDINGVPSPSIDVYLNDQQVVAAGEGQMTTSFDATVNEDSFGRYDVSIAHNSPFPEGESYTVTVSAQDTTGNTILETYSFTSETFAAFVDHSGTVTSYNSIIEAVEAASANDTVMIVDGTHYEGQVVTLNKNLTITSYLGNSSNVVVDGGGTHRVFRIDSGATVTISSLTIQNGYIYLSSSSYGGGIFLNSGSLYLDDIRALTCTADNYGKGGFLYLSSGTSATVNGSLIRGNYGENFSGAIHVDSADLSSFGNIYESNTAENAGGGAIYFNSGTARFENNIFWNNQCINSPGGAMWINGGFNYSGANNVFYGNDADGGTTPGGAVMNFGTYYAVNDIYDMNSNSVGNESIYNGSTMTIIYSCIPSGNTAVNNYDFEAAVGNILYDPQFVDPDNGNFLPSVNSSVINGGTSSTAPAEDIDGNSRPYAWAYDMGAYEVTYPLEEIAFNISHGDPITYNSIQEALNEVSANDVIVVTINSGINERRDIYWPNTENVTLRGMDGSTSADVVITGADIHRIFKVNYPVSLNISGLSLVSGSTGIDNGAGIWLAAGATLNMSRVRMYGNRIQTAAQSNDYARGGAVFSEDAAVNVDECEFIGNSAYYTAVGYGGIWNVTNSLFDSNFAQVFGGVGAQSEWYVTGSIFTNNIANGSPSQYHSPGSMGGGVLFEGNLTAVNSIFSGNRANGSTGGVVKNGMMSAVNCVFKENYGYFSSGVIELSYFGGPAVYSNIINCSFIGNTTAGSGGVAFGSNSNRWVIKNSIFWGNMQDTDGTPVTNSFIYMTGSGSSYSNIESGVHGSLIDGGGNISIDPAFRDGPTTDLRLVGNSPMINSGTASGAPADDLAGNTRPIYAAFDMGVYERKDFYISEHTPAKGASAVPTETVFSFRLQDSIYPSSDLMVTVNINGLEYYGTSLNIIETAGSATSTDLSVSVDLTLALSTTYYVTINITSPGDSLVEAYQFAAKDPDIALVIHSGVTSNYTSIISAVEAASANDTVLVKLGTHIEAGTVTINKNLTIGPVAGGNSTNVIIDGGGIQRVLMVTDNAVVSINNLTIQNGYVTGNGAGIYLSGAGLQLNLINVIVTGNNARVITIEGLGGGLRIAKGSSANINNCLFSGNTAFAGAGISNTGYAYVYSSTIENNNTYESGTGWGLGSGFVNYTATNDYSEIPVAVIEKTIFKDNYAPDYGAAIENDLGVLTVNNCLFVNNTTGIEAAGRGGTIHNWIGTANIINSTFYGNSGRGIMHYHESGKSGKTTVVNTIVAGTSTGNGIYNYDGDADRLIVINSNIYGNLDADYSGNVTTANVISEDPLFVDAVGGDFRLQTSPTLSPAIDAGDSSVVVSGDVDLDGAARIQGYAVDMGAYESSASYDPNPPYFVDFHPSASTEVSRDTMIAVSMYDDLSGIVTGSFVLYVNDVLITENISFSPVTAGYRVTYDPAIDLDYFEQVLVTMSVQDVIGNEVTLTRSFSTESATPSFTLKVYLQGYYDTGTGLHKPATVNMQFRASKWVSSAVSFDMPLDSSGSIGDQDFAGLTPGTYYLLIRHQLPSADIGVNHMPVLLDQSIVHGAGALVIDLADSAGVNYRAPYISSSAQAPAGGTLQVLLTESNGKLVMRGGNAIADADNAINIADFSTWRNEWRGYAGAGSVADFNADGIVDTLDFAIWSENNQHMYPTEY